MRLLTAVSLVRVQQGEFLEPINVKFMGFVVYLIKMIGIRVFGYKSRGSGSSVKRIKE